MNDKIHYIMMRKKKEEPVPTITLGTAKTKKEVSNYVDNTSFDYFTEHFNIENYHNWNPSIQYPKTPEDIKHFFSENLCECYAVINNTWEKIEIDYEETYDAIMKDCLECEQLFCSNSISGSSDCPKCIIRIPYYKRLNKMVKNINI